MDSEIYARDNYSTTAGSIEPTMIRRVPIKNFKRFRKQAFKLAESVILAGPNNAGKSTLLQAVALWKFVIDQWVAQREGERAVERSDVAVLLLTSSKGTTNNPSVHIEKRDSVWHLSLGIKS